MTDSPARPISRRVRLVGASVLILTLVAIVADRQRARTGELLVQTSQVGRQVILKRQGIWILGPTDRRSFTLPPGTYEVVSVGSISQNVAVRRGEKSVCQLPNTH